MPSLFRPLFCLLGLLVFLTPVWGKLQFDVFLGYDNTVRTMSWFPVSVEVFNDGPSFDGSIEVSPGQLGGQRQRYQVELPTGTRKRIIFPAFASGGGIFSLDVRLVDSSGRIREDRPSQRPRMVSWHTYVLGALPGQFAGLPVFPKVDNLRGDDATPIVVRIQPEFFPDNPLALEELNGLYLNSEKALLLKEKEVEALQAWVQGGGHLIVTVEQPGDLGTATWLRDLLPAQVRGLNSHRMDGELHKWLIRDDLDHPGQPGSPLRFGYEPPHASDEPSRTTPFSRLSAQVSFDRSDLPLVGLRPLSGALSYGPTNAPLIVSSPRGRGLVTVLAFNPERDPIKTWKFRPEFWARLAGVPQNLLLTDRAQVPTYYGSRSLDTLFGAMVETTQIRKLPVGALLLLLVAYLAVIGPIDQWWLKKINRPMLTWLTFPAYVALFSLLIYWIGFKLRAGQTEWNELHVADLFPRIGGAEIRGRTFASIYSPANETYHIGSDVANATLRPESGGLWMGNRSEGRSTLQLAAKNGFAADIYVPVWTSQMHVSDWEEEMSTPVKAVLTETADGFAIRVENTLDKPFDQVWVIHSGTVHELGALGTGQRSEYNRRNREGRVLREWVRQFQSAFATAAVERQKILGGGVGGTISDWGVSSVAASFPSLLQGPERDGIYPLGSDLTPLVERGDTLLFAWIPGETLIPTLNKFPVVRSRKGTLVRLVVAPSKP